LDIDRIKNTYDLIILEHVLEHLPHPLKALKNIHKILKPKGYVTYYSVSSESSFWT